MFQRAGTVNFLDEVLPVPLRASTEFPPAGACTAGAAELGGAENGTILAGLLGAAGVGTAALVGVVLAVGEGVAVAVAVAVGVGVALVAFATFADPPLEHAASEAVSTAAMRIERELADRMVNLLDMNGW